MNLMPVDELNAFKDKLESGQFINSDGKVNTKQVEDSILDLLIMAYVFGETDVDTMLGTASSPQYEEMQSVIYKKVGDKDFSDRVKQYDDVSKYADIFRVAETDMHRVYNESAYNTAVKGGATKKTWQTMEDDKVRDAHWWLQGITVPIDAEFYTEGASAQHPNGFGVPELDINCRCWLTYSK